MHFGFGGFGVVGMIIFWVVFVGAIVFLVRVFSNSVREHKSGSQTPMEILKKRYARGEINHDEYERMKHDLVGK